MSKNGGVVAMAEFKARCTRYLTEVERSGQRLIVTRRGKPVAVVQPAAKSSTDWLKGSVLYEGDVLSPIDVTWKANR